MHTQLPEHGFLRLKAIIGDKEAGIPPLIPVSKSTWWQGVREGRFPRPVKLSERVTCWKASDIRRLLDDLGSNDETQHEAEAA